ncbi:Os06g0640933, partial [Oryza sativa Japonica Group]
QEVGLAARRDAERLCHVELGRVSHTGGLPVDVEEQAGEWELHVCEPERHPGAHPPAAAERQELEVGALEVHRGGRLAVAEPLRPELLRRAAGPVPLVAADRPGVHQHLRAARHVVAEHPARLPALAREQQRQRRVQPERLPDDEAKVRELADGERAL